MEFSSPEGGIGLNDGAWYGRGPVKFGTVKGEWIGRWNCCCGIGEAGHWGRGYWIWEPRVPRKLGLCAYTGDIGDIGVERFETPCGLREWSWPFVCLGDKKQFVIHNNALSRAKGMRSENCIQKYTSCNWRRNKCICCVYHCSCDNAIENLPIWLM